nr:MAG TPA: hypothetical protein [Caudoviricetes sp.]
MIRNVATSGVHSNLLRWSVHKCQHPVRCFCKYPCKTNHQFLKDL